MAKLKTQYELAQEKCICSHFRWQHNQRRLLEDQATQYGSKQDTTCRLVDCPCGYFVGEND